MHKKFGIKENVEYRDREGAYLIPHRGSQIGVIETPKGYFLLGGGLENDETHAQCIQRECIEEAGCSASVTHKLCSAEAYAKHSDIGYLHHIQTYYCGNLSETVSAPSEKDHKLCWIEYERLNGKMFAEMQNWALVQFSKLIMD